MPRRNDDNDTERKGGKFSKNVKFSREKSFAYSEADIERNDAKLKALNKERSKERKHNLKVANGTNEEEDDDDDDDDDDESPKFVRQYYLKMNLVVNDVPADYDVDKLCKKFERFGTIQYVSKDMNANGSYNAIFVPDEWNELIKPLQQDIFDKGSAEYKIMGSVPLVCNITRDSTQDFEEYGEAIKYLDSDS